MMRTCRPLAALRILLLLSFALLGSVPEAPARADEVRPPTPAGKRLLGYYVPYDSTSWAVLESQSPHIDTVALQWVTIDACGRLTSQENQTLKQFARSQGIQILPSLLTNSNWLNQRILTDPETTDRALAEIVAYVEAEGYDGFDLDLEAVRPADRDAFTAFVARLAAALHERGKPLALAIPAKQSDTTTGWAGAYDYAALGKHADLITIMAYEFHGAWGEPGPIAPFDGVERTVAFAVSQIPSEKVLLGLAFYGFDWNTTSGGGRYLGYPEAAILSERHNVPPVVDPKTRSVTFRYQAPAGDTPPKPIRPPAPPHEIVTRQAPPCPVPTPVPGPTPTPRPSAPPDAIQQHVVWLEESTGAAARLELANRYGIGGVATWRLGHEDPPTWEVVRRWRQAGP
jgi:spore germination protein